MSKCMVTDHLLHLTCPTYIYRNQAVLFFITYRYIQNKYLLIRQKYKNNHQIDYLIYENLHMIWIIKYIRQASTSDINNIKICHNKKNRYVMTTCQGDVEILYSIFPEILSGTHALTSWYFQNQTFLLWIFPLYNYRKIQSSVIIITYDIQKYTGEKKNEE